MSYRPRSRSPEYRHRRYSPSRPLSRSRSRSPPPPPRRYDDHPPARYSPPPPRRYDDERERLAPARRTAEDFFPPPARRGDYPPHPSRRDDYDDYPPPPRRYENHPPAPRDREMDERYAPRGREDPSGRIGGARDRRDERSGSGMAADVEEIKVREAPRGPAPQPRGGQWERGRDVEELVGHLCPLSEDHGFDTCL